MGAGIAALGCEEGGGARIVVCGTFVAACVEDWMVMSEELFVAA